MRAHSRWHLICGIQWCRRRRQQRRRTFSKRKTKIERRATTEKIESHWMVEHTENLKATETKDSKKKTSKIKIMHHHSRLILNIYLEPVRLLSRSRTIFFFHKGKTTQTKILTHSNKRVRDASAHQPQNNIIFSIENDVFFSWTFTTWKYVHHLLFSFRLIQTIIVVSMHFDHVFPSLSVFPICLNGRQKDILFRGFPN